MFGRLLAAAGASRCRHMTPCACHCAACRAAGHGDGVCVALCAGLHELFDGKGDVADLILRHLRHYSSAATTNYGGWTARFDVAIGCVQYGPTGDVIAAGGADQRIHLSCAQTGDTIGCPLSLFGSGDEANSDCPMRGHSKDEECGRASMAREGSRVDARCGSVHRSQTLTV
eukprot:Tamp_21898.p1 GENE.Tamp_21898~~Tamp_21898.p1  ORF type:complete len:172 (-),score=18.19 Tamp_21898:603-1118(-)